MRRGRRPIGWFAGIPLAFALACVATPRLTVHADTPPPPVVTRVTPLSIVENGQPIRVTLTGTGMSGVNIVFLSPVVAQRSFAAFNDTTLLLTLPADLPAGDYSITLQSAGGTSDPSGAVVGVRTAPIVPGGASGPVTIPQYSFAPYPNDVPAPVPNGGTPAHASIAGPAPAALVSGVDPTSNPPLIIAVGVLAGGLMILLWGSPGRAEVARRRGFLAQLVTRPVQKLRLGRICLQCGRLHWRFATRRDLWKAGQFCSATCFVAAQEEDITVRDSDSVAGSRLRGMGIYAELEVQLEIVFAGEAASVGTAVSLFGAEGSWTLDDLEMTGVEGETTAPEPPDAEPDDDQVASVLEASTLVEAARFIESSDRRARRASVERGRRARDGDDDTASDGAQAEEAITA